jgi:hypothetical protein
MAGSSVRTFQASLDHDTLRHAAHKAGRYMSSSRFSFLLRGAAGRIIVPDPKKN